MVVKNKNILEENNIEKSGRFQLFIHLLKISTTETRYFSVNSVFALIIK